MYKVAMNTSKQKQTSFQELINHFIYLGKGKFNGKCWALPQLQCAFTYMVPKTRDYDMISDNPKCKFFIPKQWLKYIYLCEEKIIESLQNRYSTNIYLFIQYQFSKTIYS